MYGIVAVLRAFVHARSASGGSASCVDICSVVSRAFLLRRRFVAELVRAVNVSTSTSFDKTRQTSREADRQPNVGNRREGFSSVGGLVACYRSLQLFKHPRARETARHGMTAQRCSSNPTSYRSPYFVYSFSRYDFDFPGPTFIDQPGLPSPSYSTQSFPIAARPETTRPSPLAHALPQETPRERSAPKILWRR